MNCAFDKEKLTGYYDGELDAAEKAEVERHIAACSECLRELGELKSAALLVKDLPRLRAPRSIADGVKREIQAAGKVHRFAVLRRNLMWAAAAAAGLLIVMNVVYFSSADMSAAREPMAAKARQVPAMGDAALSAPPPPAAVRTPEAREDVAKSADQDGARRALDRAAGEKPAVEEMERRKNLSEGKAESLARAEEKRVDPAKPTTLAPAPEPKPVPKPEAPAPVVAAKEEPRPGAPSEKAAEAKRDAEAPGRADDAKAKKAASAEPAPETPVHMTLASMQMAKARPQVEEALRKMGVALPQANAQTRSATRSTDAYTLELTDSQLARLRAEVEKQSYSRLVLAGPGDEVLKQYGDAGLFRGREKGVVSGGAAAPAAPPAPAKKPAGESAKDFAAEPKESADAPVAKAAADKLDKGPAEPRRKVVLHFLEALSLPDPQPAAESLKK